MVLFIMHGSSSLFSDSLGEKHCCGYFRYPQSNPMSSILSFEITLTFFLWSWLLAVFIICHLWWADFLLSHAFSWLIHEREHPLPFNKGQLLGIIIALFLRLQSPNQKLPLAYSKIQNSLVLQGIQSLTITI